MIDFQKSLDAIRATSTGEISLVGTNKQWSRITIMLSGKQMSLTSLLREQPGDKFSRLVLSMHNFFRVTETFATSNKSQVLSRIENVKMMIGVVAEPEFEDVDSRLDTLWAIVESLDALIFNGDAILNSQGERLLDCNGEFDVLI